MPYLTPEQIQAAQDALWEGIETEREKDNRLQILADYQTIFPQLPDRARILLDTGHLLTAN